jgi:microsomal dipeptidase-like Zn-dependent dipeptidase
MHNVSNRPLVLAAVIAAVATRAVSAQGPAVATVAVTPATVSVSVGGSVLLGVTLRDHAGRVITGRTVTWTSRNSSVATVSPSGVVTGVAPGLDTVTAAADRQSGFATLTVTPPPVYSVTVTPVGGFVVVGGPPLPLTTTLRDARGNVLAGRVVTWFSGTPSVATVSSSGSVTGIAAGAATIRASAEGRSASAVITVSRIPSVSAHAAPLPIRGFVDTHSHQFGNLGFGGLLLWGKAYSLTGATPEQQLADALPWCDFMTPDARAPFFRVPVHGPGGTLDLIGNGMRWFNGYPNDGHRVGGQPLFDGWPSYDSYTHQQMYVDWLQRAFQGGLKLLVVHAVNNEVFCGLAKRVLSCNDMEAVDRQLNAARELEKLIDDRNGGLGRGWYRIVRSGREAREAINRGQLAVVLGIEVDNLFNCRAYGNCTAKTLQLELQKYHDLGVRHVFPIHLANNGFGGAALYEDMFNLNNASLTGRFFDAFDCSSLGIEFRFDLTRSGAMYNFFHPVVSAPPPPAYPSGGNCNVQGLTPLGEFLVHEMIRLRMIIDIDHMSWRAADRALAIAESLSYPVVAGHTGFLTTSIGNKKSEGQRTPDQLARIRRLGGLVSPILHQGSTEHISAWGSKVPNDCNTSSKSWAQAYLYAVDAMGGRDTAAVGFGSDFNGLAGEPAPRFGDAGCDNNKEQQAVQSHPVTYPFAALATGVSLQPMRSGDRVFVYDVDGVSNVGLLPEFVEDLRHIGLDSRDLAPLLRSAEAYVAMWERIDARTPHP